MPSLSPIAPTANGYVYGKVKPSLAVTGFVVSFGLSCLALLYIAYRLSEISQRHSTLTFSGLVVAGLVGAIVVALIRYIRRLSPESQRQASLAIAMNVVAGVLMVASGEGALRILHEISMRQPTWGITFPMVRNWNQVSAAFLGAIDSDSFEHTYHEYDPTLGWTVGKSRRSKDGLYASSKEGLRSQLGGEQLLQSPAVSVTGLSPKPTTIALAGDSFTFGVGVAFQESWGYLLGVQMGPDFNVLNYGVAAYSVNQSRLRYQQDVRQIHPHIVILSVISHDFLRDTFVYNFLAFPDTVTYPYARPRPILRNGELGVLNIPLITPKIIFATSEVQQLPHLTHDPNWNWMEWERSPWQLLQRSFLFRHLTSSLSGLSISQQQAFHQEAQELGVAVLKSFVAGVRADGAIPVLVYFPDMWEMDATLRPPPTNHVGLAPKILQAAGLRYIDTTPCINPVPPSSRYLPHNSGHFTVESNAAIAGCLPDLIRRQLADEDRTATSQARELRIPH